MATKGRGTRVCDTNQARQRLQRASEFLDVASLVVDEKDKDASPVYASAAASLAVLAGIAASDAACCATLGERSRSENHRDAERLLDQINATELKRVMRRAESLVAFAEEALRR